MKKMMFLMLTLLIMGAANVNAQVQIGGTKGPDKSAVLDLNGDAGTANGGLALPRVELTSTTQQLNGATAQPGTVVYNTGTALVGEGTYVWTKVDGSGSSSGTEYTGISVDNTGTGTTVTGNGTDASKLKVSVKDKGIDAAQLAQMGATTGQSLVWNGTAWAPQNVIAFDVINLTIAAGDGSIYVPRPDIQAGRCSGKTIIHADAYIAGNPVALPQRFTDATLIVWRPSGQATTSDQVVQVYVSCY